MLIRSTRYICCAALLGLALVMICPLFVNKEPDADTALKKISESLIKKCPPSIQDDLTKLENEHDILAFAATLKARYQTGSRNGLEKLAQAVSQNDDLQLRLADIAVKKLNEGDSETREDFFRVHYAALEPLESSDLLPDDPDLANKKAELRNKYLKTLESAAQNVNTWYRVRVNPVYVMLLTEVQDESLLDYYEKEKDWLDDVISVVVAGDLDMMTSDVNLNEENLSLSDILTIAKENDPYFKEALIMHLDNQASVPSKDISEDNANGYFLGVNSIINLFSSHGGAIKIATKERIPLDETLSVLFGNWAYFESKKEEEIAAILIKTKKERPNVWESCTRYSYILDVTDGLEPDLANRLCKEYEKYDIGVLLYSQYEDAIPQAARAIDKFPELGVAVLTQYSNSENFRKFLKDDELGPRVIPYVAAFGDKGLARLSNNKMWLDKYFDEEGNQKDKGWIENLPGGSLYTVAKNWANGIPNEWGELGWAALDVADIALTVATVGTSSAATSGAKTAAKASLKAAGTAAARRAGGSLVSKTSRNPQLITSLFKSGLRGTKRALIVVCKTKAGRVILRTLKITGNASCKLISFTTRLPKAAYQSWKALPGATKKAIYRAALTGCILTQIWFKTIPATKVAIKKTADYVGRIPVKITEAAINTIHTSLNGFIDELRKDALNGFVSAKDTVVRILCVLLLVICVYFLMPKRPVVIKHLS